MLELLGAPEAIAFSAALVLMIAIGLIEAFGLGTHGFHIDLDSGPLDWLGVGKMPVLVLLIAFLAAFGGIGLAGQQIASVLTGDLLHPAIAIPAALAAAVPVTAILSRILARVLPHDETTAFELDDLIGFHGVVTIGRAAVGSPARTRVLDPHGQPHHVLVEPNDPAATFEEGDTVLLVRREGSRFRAVLHTSPRFTNWID